MGTMCSEGNFYPRSPCGERRQPPSKATDPKAHFYPRSPCGERPEITDKYFDDDEISIHALLAESDAVREMLAAVEAGFLSTLSLRRATRSSLIRVWMSWDFYPRSPCGERLHAVVAVQLFGRISIHALLAESDFVF